MLRSLYCGVQQIFKIIAKGCPSNGMSMGCHGKGMSKSHSKEVSQQRGLTAERSHSKKVSQQRNLTAKKSHSREIS